MCNARKGLTLWQGHEFYNLWPPSVHDHFTNAASGPHPLVQLEQIHLAPTEDRHLERAALDFFFSFSFCPCFTYLGYFRAAVAMKLEQLSKELLSLGRTR